MCDVEMVGCDHCWQVIECGFIYIIKHLLCNAIGVEGDTNVDAVSGAAVPANGAQLQITDFQPHNFLFYFVARTLMPKHFGT